ncbi:MAG: glutamyl-tRNA reductase [Candidatus Omnitrophica bacterium]|nr:glutamyl-tRNA reductase [Candidatus Omnitrophota bacterium]
MRSGVGVQRMISQLLVVGLSHQTAPLALRERLAIPARQLPEALASVRACAAVSEAAILSTCNRVELYVAAREHASTHEGLRDFLRHQSRLAAAQLDRVLYRRSGTEAAAHLFRVAAGLDSMILGESEVTAQVKQAYDVARAAGAAGPLLHRLFQKALHSTKVVRSGTRIAEGRVSIGSVIVTLAEQAVEGRLASCEVLLWGAGKAAETTARHLIKHGVRRLWVVNRTATGAQALAALCQTGWLSWEQARARLETVDLAVICTQAPHYVMDCDDLAAILPRRGSRPLCLIDLAVPRNVDPAARRMAGVRLYDVDDLTAIADASRRLRAHEQVRCETLIHDQVQHFCRGVWSQPEEERACRTPVACLAV